MVFFNVTDISIITDISFTDNTHSRLVCLSERHHGDMGPVLLEKQSILGTLI